MLGVSRMTIYRRIEEGVLHPVYDFKNVAHVRWDEINEILQNLRKNGWN